MKIELQTPPNESLLSSMLYEGYIRILGECGEEADEDCIANILERLLKEIEEKVPKEKEKNEKHVIFEFVENDSIEKINKKFNRSIDRRGFQDLMDFLKDCVRNQIIQDLVIKAKLSKVKKRSGKGVALLIGTQSFIEKGDVEEDGYAFQIMKIDRYTGISSMESGLFAKQITTYADLSGLLMFFAGLASSYVVSMKTNYYFLFFDVATLLSWVLAGGASNMRNWMNIKDELSKKIGERIKKYGDIDDEIILLSVLLSSDLLERLRRSFVNYVGFRLVKVSKEGGTYKIYVNMPLRIYPYIKLERRGIEGMEKELDKLIELASGFIKNKKKRGGRKAAGKGDSNDGYHAFMALRYLYLYVTTGNPEYLSMMRRHEVYLTGGLPVRRA